MKQPVYNNFKFLDDEIGNLCFTLEMTTYEMVIILNVPPPPSKVAPDFRDIAYI